MHMQIVVAGKVAPVARHERSMIGLSHEPSRSGRSVPIGPPCIVAASLAAHWEHASAACWRGVLFAQTCRPGRELSCFPCIPCSIHPNSPTLLPSLSSTYILPHNLSSSGSSARNPTTAPSRDQVYLAPRVVSSSVHSPLHFPSLPQTQFHKRPISPHFLHLLLHHSLFVSLTECALFLLLLCRFLPVILLRFQSSLSSAAFACPTPSPIL